jgi:hypothetical protein
MAWDPDAPTESDSEYDGFASYSSEWHAMGIGFAVGFASVMPVPRLKRFVFGVVGLGDETRSKAMREARKESWYALGAVIAGALFGLVSLVTVASVAL